MPQYRLKSDDGRRYAPFIRALRRIVRLLTLVSVVGLALNWRETGKLPPSSRLLDLLRTNPEQSLIRADPYEIDYENTEYTIEPKANYAIRGLLVTHNNISAFDDIYHTSKSVDIKDLCVVWGDNLKAELYQKMKFWSEPFSCWAYTGDSSIAREFNPAQLSNTHVLSDNEHVREVIRRMKVGDQIELRGQLVDYFPTNHPDFKRRTSLVRDDTANGACEVMLVDDAQILDTFNHSAYSHLKRFGFLLVVTFLLELLMFVVQAQADARRW